MCLSRRKEVIPKAKQKLEKPVLRDGVNLFKMKRYLSRASPSRNALGSTSNVSTVPSSCLEYDNMDLELLQEVVPNPR